MASRYVNGVSIVNWPLHRLIISKLGTAYARIVTELPITDCTAGYKCYRREVLETIGMDTIRANGYVFQIETSFRAWHAGFTLKDFPIIFHERQFGDSKLNLSITLVIESGATPKEAQVLARHSTIELTMNTYARTRQHRLNEITEKVANAIEYFG